MALVWLLYERGVDLEGWRKSVCPLYKAPLVPGLTTSHPPSCASVGLHMCESVLNLQPAYRMYSINIYYSYYTNSVSLAVIILKLFISHIFNVYITLLLIMCV